MSDWLVIFKSHSWRHQQCLLFKRHKAILVNFQIINVPIKISKIVVLIHYRFLFFHVFHISIKWRTILRFFFVCHFDPSGNLLFLVLVGIQNDSCIALYQSYLWLLSSFREHSLCLCSGRSLLLITDFVLSLDQTLMIEVLEPKNQGKRDAFAHEVQEEDEHGVAEDVCFLQVRYDWEIEHLDVVECQPIQIGDWKHT